MAVAPRPLNLTRPPVGMESVASAVVTGERIVTVQGAMLHSDGDPGDRGILRYAQACAALAMDEVTFLWESSECGFVRVWVRSLPGEQLWEVDVAPLADAFSLTPRELKVLTLIVGGLSNVDIGRLLGTSPKTVGVHVAHLLAKLDQSTRAGAAAMAIDQGLVLLPLEEGAQSLTNLSIGLLHAWVQRRSIEMTARRPSRRRPIRQPLSVGCVLPGMTSHGDAFDAQHGADLAIARINARGGVNGRALRLVTIDADVWSRTAMGAAMDSLMNQGIHGLIFGYSLDFPGLAAIAAQAATYDVPVLQATTSATLAELLKGDPGHFGSIFHLGGSDDVYGEGFVDVVAELSAQSLWHYDSRRIAVLDSFAGSTIMSDAVAARAEDAGWDIRRVVRPAASGAVGAVEVISRLKDIDPSAILISSFMDEELLLTVLGAFTSARPRPLIYALYTPAISGFIDRAGDLAEGLVWSTMCGRYDDQIATAFVKEFADRFSRHPGHSQAGVHFDAVNLLAKAWSEVTHASQYREVQQQLRSGIHRGVNGAYSFSAPGQISPTYLKGSADPSVSQAHLTYQIQDGENRIIAPRLYATASFRQPRPRSAPQK